MNLLCVIPARGGSKGIPRKNIVDLCGRPLIDYTIATCLAAGVFTRIVVSTDDPEIAEVARASGAEAPFLRPRDLAGDAVSPQSAVEYTLERLKRDGYVPQGLAILFPTHLFRTVSMLRQLTGLMAAHHVVKTVIPIRPHPLLYLSENSGGSLEPLLAGDESLLAANRYHAPAGTFFGVNMGPHRREYYLHELADPIERIDIDSPADLEEAREVIARGLYDFRA